MSLSKFVFFETPFEQYECRLAPYTQNEKMFEIEKVWIPEGGKQVIKSGQRLCLPPPAWAGLKSSIVQIESLEQPVSNSSSPKSTTQASTIAKRNGNGDQPNPIKKERYHGGRKRGARNKWSYVATDTDLGPLTDVVSQFKLCYRVPTKMLVEKAMGAGEPDTHIQPNPSNQTEQVKEDRAARNLLRKRVHKATELKRDKERRDKLGDSPIILDDDGQDAWPTTDIKIEPSST